MKNFKYNDFLPTLTQLVIGLVLGILLFILTGCEKSYPTYPDIDGEYVIDHVNVIIEDQVTGVRKDTVYFTGTFSLYMPETPLDSFEVGVTRFKFTDAGRTFMWNKDMTVFGNPWLNETTSILRQDFLSGEWDILQIHFLYTNTATRVFELSMVGLDDFSAWVRQYPFKAEGPEYQVRYHFHEVGP